MAGPVIRKTSAAPGVSPLAIKTAAIGTEAVAQTYTGIPRSIMTTIAKNPVPSFSAKKSLGMAADMSPASKRPRNIAFPMSLGSVMKPYLSASSSLRLVFLHGQPGSVQCVCGVVELFLAGSISEGCLSKSCTLIPPIRPVMKVTSGRKIAKIGPNRL